MKKLRTAAFLLFSIVVAFTGTAVTNAHQEKSEKLELSGLFKEHEGAVVLKNLETGNVYVYNEERSAERFTPESTFKVPNALIGLETEAVKDEYEVKRWDGVVREFESWNQDHSLASAMRQSAIWFYQDMARDIGMKAMQKYIQKMNYGNQDLTGGIDSFWLDSSLEISALEQVNVMEKLVREKLPFKEKHQKTVKRMMIDDEQDDYTLHGKTGTRLSDLGLGWYVGFVENKKNTWVFAVNVNGTGTAAKQITLEVLRQKKIIKN